MIENLIRKSNLLVNDQQLAHKRWLFHHLDWNDRLIGITGARGTGKTTLLLQKLKSTFGLKQQALYITLDDMFFTETRLVDVAEKFVQIGGQALFIDEVHKYPGWAVEIKNIYDFYKDIQIIFTGSSIIEMTRQDADLSRRAVQYELSGLSFREYLALSEIAEFPVLRLDQILQDHVVIAQEIGSSIKPLKYFSDYLTFGYYPFFKESQKSYLVRLERVVKMIIETDLRFIEGFDPHNTRKIFQLLYILAINVPFKPNISKLADKIGIHRNTLVQYIHYLEKARLINSLTAAGKSVSILQKPDKIFLENTNLLYALSPATDKGSLRESFFLNQLHNAGYKVTLPLSGDFLVDEQFTFEVGGRAKKEKQIGHLEKSFVVADDMESGALNKIPLWLFGFLY